MESEAAYERFKHSTPPPEGGRETSGTSPVNSTPRFPDDREMHLRLLESTAALLIRYSLSAVAFDVNGEIVQTLNDSGSYEDSFRSNPSLRIRTAKKPITSIAFDGRGLITVEGSTLNPDVSGRRSNGDEFIEPLFLETSFLQTKTEGVIIRLFASPLFASEREATVMGYKCRAGTPVVDAVRNPLVVPRHLPSPFARCPENIVNALINSTQR